MIYGIDEAGRGTLAGPVTAACVAFQFSDTIREQHFIKHALALADSKTLTPKQRNASSQFIRKYYLWGIGWAYPHEIDTYNIHHATLLAMQRAFHQTIRYGRSIKYIPRDTSKDIVLVDGIFTPDIPLTTKAKVKGDSYIPQIQAASIVAKVARDTFMHMLHHDMPEYKFITNKGYPTKNHKNALHHYGIRDHIHRKSFCKKIL